MKRKEFSKKTLLRRSVAVAVAALLVIPYTGTALAADTYDIYGTGENSFISIDGVNYYDIYNGQTKNRPSVSDENMADFLMDVMKKHICVSGASGSVTEYIAPQQMWAEIADGVYKSTENKNGSQAFWDKKKLGWNGGFRKNGIYLGDNSIKQNVADWLSDSDGYSATYDNTKVKSTMLQSATNLKSVEDETYSLISGLIDRKNTNTSDFDKYHDIAGLDDTTNQIVLYKLFGQTYHYDAYNYNYNVFGMAFYDFQVHGIIDDSAYDSATGNMTLDEAIAQKDAIDGFSYDDNTTGQVSYLINKDISDASTAQSETTNITSSMGNSVSNSNSHTDGGNVGGAVKASVKFPIFKGKADLDAGLEISAGMNWSDCYSTAYSQDKSISDSISNSTSVDVPLPAQTAAKITQGTGTRTITLDYDSPVCITYKTIIFSIGGNDYDDNMLIGNLENDAVSFYTVFGNDTDESSAVANLNNRANLYKSTSGYEETYGITNGERSYKDDNWTRGINWSKFDTPRLSYLGGGLEITGQIAPFACANQPMSIMGATMTNVINGTQTTVGETIPLYPLASVSHKYAHVSYDMKAGEDMNINAIKLNAMNKEGVDYYGFYKGWGHWELQDVNGNPADASIATLEDDPVALDVIVHAKKAGTVYAKYIIDSDKYTSYEAPDVYATDETITSYPIRIDITQDKISFDGTITVDGSLDVTVGDDPIELDGADGLTVTAKDKSDKEVALPFVWEAQELESKGIKVENNMLTVTKPGTFHIRATYADAYSNWAIVNAIAPEVVATTPAIVAPEEDEEVITGKTTLTRGELAQALYKYAGSPDVDLDDIPFSDVSADATCAEAVAWLAEEGIVNGKNGGLFDPDAAVTQEQLAKILRELQNYMDELAEEQAAALAAEEALAQEQAEEQAEEDAEDDVVAPDTTKGQINNVVLDPRIAERTSKWAEESMQWAADNGIIDVEDVDGTKEISKEEAHDMMVNYMNANPDFVPETAGNCTDVAVEEDDLTKAQDEAAAKDAQVQAVTAAETPADAAVETPATPAIK